MTYLAIFIFGIVVGFLIGVWIVKDNADWSDWDG